MTATSIIVPLVLGVLVTLVSAWVPARRAGNIPPVQAMHQDSNTAMGSLKGRTIAGVVFLVAGIVVAAVAGASMVGKPGFITVGVGALAMMLGLFLAGPALSKPAVYALGSLISRCRRSGRPAPWLCVMRCGTRCGLPPPRSL
ncbi:MAG: hypothetical protein U1U88_001546 [Lawsonella clevelandensis]